MWAGVAGRALELQLPCGQGVAVRTAAFLLAMRAGVAVRAMRAALAVRTAAFPLAMRAWVAGRARFSLPCGQWLQSTQLLFHHADRGCRPRSCVSACRARRVAGRAVVLHLAVRTRSALHALVLLPAMRTPLLPHRSRSMEWSPSLRTCASSARSDVRARTRVRRGRSRGFSQRRGFFVSPEKVSSQENWLTRNKDCRRNDRREMWPTALRDKIRHGSPPSLRVSLGRAAPQGCARLRWSRCTRGGPLRRRGRAVGSRVRCRVARACRGRSGMRDPGRWRRVGGAESRSSRRSPRWHWRRARRARRSCGYARCVVWSRERAMTRAATRPSPRRSPGTRMMTMMICDDDGGGGVVVVLGAGCVWGGGRGRGG